MSKISVFLDRFSQFCSSTAKQRSARYSLAVLLVLGSVVPPAFSETVELIPAKDNTIFSDLTSNSNGSGINLFAGSIRTGGNRRALMDFDVKSAIPAGSTIDSVSLRMVVNMTRAGSVNSALHRLESDWGEGASAASGAGGQGTTAAAGDATWSSTGIDGGSWTGGAFVAIASASASAADGPVTWTSPELAADVQSWVSGEQEEFGWILIVAEGGDRTAKRFVSREGNPVSDRPTLTIEYTATSTKTDQTIAFDAIPDQALADGAFTLAATATSQLPVNFVVVSGPATVDGTTLTFTGAGEVTVRASQAGDDTFNAAPDVDQVFNINKSDQTITFEAIPTQVLTRGSVAVTATASSGLGVTFSIFSGSGTVEGNVISYSEMGSITVRASQVGDDSFNPAPEVDQAFEVVGALDNWLMTHFTPEEIATAIIIAGDQDPDLDGLPNDVEYALGLNPRDPSGVFSGNNSVSVNDTGDGLVLRFARNTDVLDSTISIEESTDLNIWSAVAESVNGAAFQASGQGYTVSEVNGIGTADVELIRNFAFPGGLYQRIRVVR